jgi:short-subunit dehydrogenase
VVTEAGRRVVVVTGASGGIGEALGRAWGRRGATVVLSARDEAGLANAAREVETAGGRAVVHRADVTREEDRVSLVARAKAEGGIDVLVNNAGRGFYGSVAAIEPAQLEALFAVNVIAPLRLSQLALDPLTRTGGTIVMISSVAGVVASPRMGAYAASKFALEALSMSLRAEHRRPRRSPPAGRLRPVPRRRRRTDGPRRRNRPPRRRNHSLRPPRLRRRPPRPPRHAPHQRPHGHPRRPLGE